LDGVDLRLKPGADSVAVAKIVTAIFTYVMVAIAAISLLVGGIGIMNIVLATVMERTCEIGIRRAMGARRIDIVRQFLTESVVISISGGLLGVAFGVFLSWAIAQVAEWKTIVTATSVLVAFEVSAIVRSAFRIYPAMKAASIDPIEALRYE
jgi:putative ABC transport system permease protein